MIERKDEFVTALKRMVREKGPGVYAEEILLISSLSDYASDAKGLSSQRTIFLNTIRTYTSAGFLYQEIRNIYDFDAEKQKNWMRYLTDADVSKEKAAFTIVCLMESLSMDSYIYKPLLDNLKTENGSAKKNRASDKNGRRTFRGVFNVRRIMPIIVLAMIVAGIIIGIVLGIKGRKNARADAAYDSLKSAVVTNDLTAISTALNDKAYGEKNDANVEKLIMQYVSDQCDDYNNGDIDSNLAQKRVKAAAAGDFADNAEISEKLDLIDKLADSKKSYEYAKECETKAQYDTAIELYNRVIEQDSNYDDAAFRRLNCEKSYINELLAQYQTYMDSEDYDSAEALVSGALNQGAVSDPRLGVAQKEVQAILKAHKEEQDQIEIDASLAEIRTNYSNDTVGMIRELRALSSRYPDSAEIKDEIEVYEKPYKETIISGIDNVYKSEGAGAVVSYLQEALDVLGSDGDISSQLDTWKGRNKTIALDSLDIYAKQYAHWDVYNWYRPEDYMTDSFGNKYGSVLSSRYGGVSNIEYYVGNLDVGKLNFTTYLTKYGAKYCQSSSYGKMFVKVYGDDKLLYTFNNYTHTMEPTDISVDIKGVKILKIEMKPLNAYLAITNATLGY